MKHLTGKIVRTGIKVTVLCVAAITLFFCLKLFSDQMIQWDTWTGFFNWRLPWVMMGGSLLIHLLSSRVSKKISRMVRRLDTWLFTAIPLAFLCMIYLPADQSRAQMLVGIVYLGVLGLKAGLMAYLLLNNRSGQDTQRTVCWFLFICSIWFYSNIAAWVVPVHGVSGDEPHYLLMAHSLIRDGNLNLFDEYDNHEYKSFYPHELEPKPSDRVSSGEIFSRGLGATFSIILIPGYLFGGYTGAVLTMVLMAALLMVLMFQFYYREIPDYRAAMTVAMITGATIPILPHSSFIYPDIPAAVFILAAMHLIQNFGKSKKYDSTPLYLLIICTVILFLKFRYFSIIILLLFGGLLSFSRIKRRMLGYAAGILTIGLLYVAFDYFLYSGDLFINRFGGLEQIKSFLPNRHSFAVIPGFLMDQEAGLLWYVPVFFMTLPGLRLWSHHRGIVFWISCLGLPITILTLLGHFAWHCMPTPPLRYLIPVLPLWALFGVETYRRRNALKPIIRRVGIFTIGASIFASFIGILNPEWLINMADGTSRYLEALTRILHIRFTDMAPSLTRPDIYRILPWILVMSGFLFLLLFAAKSSRHREFQSFKQAPIITIAILLSCIVLGAAGARFPTTHLNAEDRFIMNPQGGQYYPVIKDPFFHQEYNYGWSIAREDSISPVIHLIPGSYQMRIRAKLTESTLPRPLFILEKDKVIARITVSGFDWGDYVIRFSRNSSAPEPVTFNRDDELPGFITIDRIDFYRTGTQSWRVYRKISRVLTAIGFPESGYRMMQYALFHHPGDPWSAFRFAFHTGAALPIPLPSANTYPIPQNDIEYAVNSARKNGMKSLINLERLFGFSARQSIENSDMEAYLITGIAAGKPSHIRTLMNSNLSDYGDSDLDLAYIASQFLSQRYELAVEKLMETLLKRDLRPMTLTHPLGSSSLSPELQPIFRDMAENGLFQRMANHKLNLLIHKAVKAYHADATQESGNDLYKLFRIDEAVFREKIQTMAPGFIEATVPQMPNISRETALVLAESLLKKHHFGAALSVAERILKKEPHCFDVRLMMAKTLYFKGRFDEAKQQCLIANILRFSSDEVRMLMNRIDSAIESSSRSRGYGFRQGAS